MTHTAATAALATICAALLAFGPPCYIGHGCTNAPTIAGLTYTGPRLARDRHDFTGTCKRVAPLLPWYN